MKRRLFVLLFAATAAASLSACLPLMAGSVAAGTLVATDRRTSGTYVEDQGIQVKALHQSERFAGAHINITSYNRAVLITGEAQDAAQSADIEMMVRGIPNVQRVYNHLVIAPATTLAQRNNDTWITTKVRTRLLDGKGYPPQAVKVVTERGVVYLLGMVTSAEGSAVANVASTTPGVQQVVTLFETISASAAPASN